MGDKKWIRRCVAAVWLAVLALTGCAAQTDSVETDYGVFDRPFVMTAAYTAGNLSGELVYRENAPENFSLEYLSPDTVAALKLTNAQGTVTAEFLEIVTQTQFSQLNPDHPLVAVSGCIARFRAERPEPRAGENGRREYTLSDGCVVVLANGVPVQLRMPAQELALEITGFDV